MAARVAVCLAAALLAVGAVWTLARSRGTTDEVAQPASSDASRLVPDATSPALSEPASLDPAPSRDPQPLTEMAQSDSDDGEGEVYPLTPERPGAGQALLRVEVVALETGAPLPGAELALFDVADENEEEDEDRDWDFSTQPDPSRGVEGDDVITDGHGRGEFVVRAGVAYELDGSGPHGLADNVEQELEPLREGEHREVRLALPTAWTFDWHARVIDGETERPLVGVEVVAYDAGADRIEDLVEMTRGRTVADGRVALRLPAWESVLVRCEQAGYFDGGCQVKEAAASFETAQTIVLRRPATLVVHVLDVGGGPAAGLEVSVSVPSWQVYEGWYLRGPSWSQSTDDEGRCEFPDLPSAADVFIQIRRGDRVLEGTSPSETFQLLPGERRSVEWRLPDGVTLSGRVRGSDGQPVSDLALHLRPSPLSFDNPVGARYHLGRWLARDNFISSDPTAASSTTDAQGAFSIDSVPSGSWLIGPRAEEFPDVVQPLVIRPGQPAFVDLVLDRNVFIRGIVLDPEGRPVRGASVHCRGTGFLAWASRCATEADGSFDAEPLLAGRYLLRADRCDEPWLAASEEVEVDSGTEAVVLRMRWGGLVRVRAQGTAGEEIPRATTCWFSPAGEPEDPMTESVLAGIHHIAVRTGDGRIGILRDVVVLPRQIQELTVEVTPGARVELAPGEHTEVEWEGLRLATYDRTVLVPAGTVIVRRFHFDNAGEERVVETLSRTLAAGDQWRVGESAEGQ